MISNSKIQRMENGTPGKWLDVAVAGAVLLVCWAVAAGCFMAAFQPWPYLAVERSSGPGILLCGTGLLAVFFGLTMATALLSRVFPQVTGFSSAIRILAQLSVGSICGGAAIAAFYSVAEFWGRTSPVGLTLTFAAGILFSLFGLVTILIIRDIGNHD